MPLYPPFLIAKISRWCSLFVCGPSLCPVQRTNAELDLQRMRTATATKMIRESALFSVYARPADELLAGKQAKWDEL